MKPFENKRVLITGATSGIGKAIAETLLEKGVNGILVGRNKETLKQFKDRFGKQTEIHTLCIELTKEKQLYKIPSYLEEKGLKIDFLIHSAGVYNMSSVQHTSDEMIDLCYKINYKAPVILTRELLKNLIESKGHIIFINSTAANQYKKFTAIYSSFKAALKSFAEILFHEEHKNGIYLIHTVMKLFSCEQSRTNRYSFYL